MMTTPRRRRTAAAVALCVSLAVAALAGPHDDDHAHETHDADAHAEHDDHDEHAGQAADEHRRVRLGPEELEEFEIEVATAGPGVIERHLELPGEVRPNADRLAHIVPRYSGIVTEVRASIGDHVEQGQTIAVIESDESLATFAVKTLIPGTVIAKHVTLGEAVTRDGDIFVIADLSSVWIDLTVYQRDLEAVEPGQQARIYVGHHLAHATGTISYVTPIVDERTRTATARVVLENRDARWRPGMFVTARVLIERAEVPVAVPVTALHDLEESTVVFVETAEGFAPQPVSTGRRSQTEVEILAGLEAGARYVSRGGFTLKAELGKGSFGHGHAH